MIMTIVVKDENIRIERFETQPFGTNAYIIACPETGESVLVDAPGDASVIMDALQGTNPTCILITHGHLDHIGALAELKETLKISVAAHQSDSGRLPLTPEMLLRDDDIIAFGKLAISVLHTPGHTPGSLCFLINSHLFSGDTIFPGGPGRTNTPEDFGQILGSLTQKIFILPDDVCVYPGHGESTVLKKEKEAFAAFSARSRPDGLCGDVLWLS